MVINFSQKRSFVPEWAGNMDQPESERIVVEHKAPDISLYNKFVPKPIVKVAVGDETKGGEVEIVIDNTKLVREMVTGIRNCTIVITPEKGEPFERVIATKDDLFKEGNPPEISGLIEEIGAYLNTALTNKVVNAKN